MQLDQDRRTLEDLITDFLDEDPQAWAPAARTIGRRASADLACLAFIQHRLAEAPGAVEEGQGTPGYRTTGLYPAGGEPPRTNTHRFCHACCAAASYLSQPQADEAPFGDVVDRWVRGPLSSIVLVALRNRGGVIGELKRIPALGEHFERWRQEQIARKRETVGELESGDDEQALAACRRELKGLEGLGDDSPIPPEFRPVGPWPGEISEMVLACYLAGVRAEAALLAFPLPLLVESMLQVGVSRPGAAPPFVMALPELLARLEGAVDQQQWRTAVSLLNEKTSADWAEVRDEYNNYTLGLAALRGAPPLRDLWLRGIVLPDWLEANLTSLERLVTDEAGRQEAMHLAARTMRAIAEKYFDDDWHWLELSRGERFSLNVYTLLMAYGPPVLSTEGGQEPLDRRRGRPDLQHRIALLMDGIQRSLRARSTVLPTLVRSMKFLLRRELAEFLASQEQRRRSQGEREAIEELMAVCRRHLLIVKPLLTDWALPQTLRKDLAVITSRVIHTAYRQQELYRGRVAQDRRGHREYVVELIYIMLYAFPDNLLLREMIEYSTDDKLCQLFDGVRQLIESFEGYDRAEAGAGTALEKVAHAEQAARDWRRRYADFAELLQVISLHDVTADVEDRWTANLCSMVDYLTRAEGMRAPEEEALDPERPLQPILTCGQRSRQPLQALLQESVGDQVDVVGTREERSERGSRLAPAARTVAGRFKSVLDDIGILENGCLPEIGRPRMGDDLILRWRRLISRMAELSLLCAQELPGLERELCTRLIGHRINHSLEPRLQRIAKIMDQEREGDAKETLRRQVQGLRLESAGGAAADKTAASGAVRDMELIQDWMLRRYMIQELAESYGLRVLGWLTRPRFVAGWILSPFVACAVLHLLGLQAWAGIPLALSCIANFVLLLAFAMEAGRQMSLVGRVRISPWRFLLPQTTAAIFLGVFQAIPSDERWSVTIKANPVVEMLTWAVFLVMGFIFTREIILGGQLRGRKLKKTRSRRAAELMSLGLWQSFTLVMFFAIVVGRIMAAPDRGSVDPEQFTGLKRLLGHLLPDEVFLGPGFIYPASSRADASFWIYPRAVITWTIQMFFFGAIFERIMGRGEK